MVAPFPPPLLMVRIFLPSCHCDYFQDPWVTGVSYLSSLHGQNHSLIPRDVSDMMFRREFPLDIQSSTVSPNTRKRCASVSITSEAVPTPS